MPLRHRLSFLTLLALIVGLAAAETSSAAVINPFVARQSITVPGDIMYVSNSSMTCDAAAANCTQARAGATSGDQASNNGFIAQYVNNDSDPTTYNASSAQLTLPAGAEVKWAGLYWQGDTGAAGTTPAPSGSAASIKLDTPAAGSYTSLGASVTYNNGTQFSSFRDITSEVLAAGQGTYTVANIASASGSYNLYAGWTIVVIYEDINEPARAMTVFDGYATVGNGDPATVNVSGFLTPPSGDVNSHVGFIAAEGDAGYTGDTGTLTSGPLVTPLTDAANPSNNFANSTLARFGSLAGSRTPSYANQLGYDADIFTTVNRIPNNATSASIALTSTQDVYYPSVVTVATDVYFPNLSAGAETTITDINGGRVEPGDTLRYNVTFQNTGEDPAERTVVTDELPAEVDYEPGSMQIISGPGGAGLLSDAAGDDRGEYQGGLHKVTLRVGAGADGANGGVLDVGEATTMSFDVRVKDLTPNGTLIANRAKATFRGQTTGQNGTAITPDAEGRVLVVYPAQLHLTGSSDLSKVRGQQIRYDYTLTNLAPDPTYGTVSFDVDPADGINVSSVSAAGWTCDPVAPDGTLHCERASSIPAGATNSLSVTADVGQDAADSSQTTAVVSGGTDATPLDNSVQITDTISSQADLKLSSDVAPASPDAGAVFAYGLDVTNIGPSDSTGRAEIVITMPDGVEFVSVQDGVFACDPVGDTVTCTGPNGIPAAAIRSATLNLRALSGGTKQIQATVTPETPGASDLTPSNNTVTDDVYFVAAPVADDDTASVAEDTQQDLAVLTNDAASPGATGLKIVSAASASPGVSSTITLTDSDHKIRYLPGADFHGTETIDYTITDSNGKTASAQVVVTVTPVNDPPVTSDDTVSVTEDSHVDSDHTTRATDVDGDTLTQAVKTGPSHGTAAVQPDGKIRYTPDADYHGTDSYTYEISDGHGGTDVGTAVVTVDPASDAPVAADLALPVTEDIAKSGTVTASDADGDSITYATLTGPSHGAVVINADGSFTYTPDADYHGADSFTFRAAAGGDSDDGTVTITVAAVNDAPVADMDSASVVEDGQVDIDVLDGDSDVDGDLLTPAVLVAPSHGSATVQPDGRIRYVPTADYHGPDTFTYRVSDGHGGTADALVSVAVTEQSDLTVELTRDPSGPVPAGRPVTLTYKITNHGPSAATNAKTTVTVPDGLQPVSFPDACAKADGPPVVLTCDAGTLADEESKTGQIVLRSLTSAVGTGQPVQAVSSADQPDPTPGTVTDTVTLSDSAHLSVTAEFVTQPRAGSNGQYVITVRNDGPATASAVQVQDDLPAGFEVVSVTPEAGGCTAGKVSCTVGDIPAGAQRKVTVVVKVPADAADKTFTRPVKLTSSTPEPDASSSRDRDVAFKVLTPLVAPKPDLKVTQTVREQNPKAGDTIHYVFRIRNQGTAGATAVQLASAFAVQASKGAAKFDAGREGSAAFELIGAYASAGSCDREKSAVACELGDVAAGEEIEVVVALRLLRAGTIRATSTVASAAGDLQLDNNTATTGKPVTRGRGRIRVTSSVSRRTVRRGQQLTYTVRVRALTATPVLNVRVCQQLPANVLVRKLGGAKFEHGRVCWRIAAVTRKTQTLRLVVRVAKDARLGVRNSFTRVYSANATRGRAVAAVRVLQSRAQLAGGVTG